MILQKDTLFVTIGNTVFRSSKFQNPQFVFDEEALKGFLDGVNVKRTEAARPNQWGDFKEPGLLGPRNLTLTGTAVADSAAQLMQMRDEFASLLTDGGYQEIEIQNSSTTRYLNAALNGSSSWVQKLDNVAVWKLELYAPDPRMYGPQRSVQVTDGTVNGGLKFAISYPMNFGGPIKTQAVTISNDGNAISWPVFRVTGDYFSGFEVTDGLNSIIRYEGIVTRTAPVFIDTARGTATQNGVDNSRMLSRRDWFGIPPESSIAPRFLPIQDAFGWCDIMYRDTWI
jgi:hypothetical protein